VTGSKEDLLAKTEEIGHMGSWEWSLDGPMVWSDNLYRLYGFEPGEREPDMELFLEHVDPFDRKAIEEAVGGWRATGSSRMTLDFHFLRPDGAVRDMRATVAQIERRGGLRILGLVVDRTDQRRAEREIAAHLAVAEVLGGWRSVEESAPGLIRGLARALNLERGALWVPRGDVLRLQAIWQAPEYEKAELESEMRELAIPRGSAATGKSWESKRPVIVTDAGSEPAYPFVDLVARERIRGTVAIPALHDGEVLAVVGLVGIEAIEPSDRLRDSLVGIGGEIGEFLSRLRGQLEPAALTSRELEILTLASSGMTGPAIAEALSISRTTVKTHFENVYAKLGVNERAAAVAIALRRGLIE
jgi:DNA-binding CsgD family transcriptional regulator